MAAFPHSWGGVGTDAARYQLSRTRLLVYLWKASMKEPGKGCIRSAAGFGYFLWLEFVCRKGLYHPPGLPPATGRNNLRVQQLGPYTRCRGRVASSHIGSYRANSLSLRKAYLGGGLFSGRPSPT